MVNTWKRCPKCRARLKKQFCKICKKDVSNLDCIPLKGGWIKVSKKKALLAQMRPKYIYLSLWHETIIDGEKGQIREYFYDNNFKKYCGVIIGNLEGGF